MSRLSERLKELRGAEAQGSFAARLGLKQAVYCHYEKGRREPSLDQLVHIATVLHTTPNDLLGVSPSSSSIMVKGNGNAVAQGSGAVASARGVAGKPGLPAVALAKAGELPQCARCEHRKLAERMRKMLAGK